jgi:hypothetical protein
MYTYVGTSDLLNDTKKHTTKSRETICSDTLTFGYPIQVGSDTITACLLDIYFIKYLGRYFTNNFALSQHKYISYTLTA